MIKARIPASAPESANLKSYDQTYAGFAWAEIENRFSWHQTGQMNIITESVDRWADDPEKKITRH